jgi:transcriptional regulator with XRE-family HTH domain
MLGCQRPTVTEMEAGRRKVSVQELVTLAEAYGVSVEWLAKGADKADGQSEIAKIAARKLESMRSEELRQVVELLSLIEEQRRDKKNPA